MTMTVDDMKAAHVARAELSVGPVVDPRDALARAMVPVFAAPAYGPCPALAEALSAKEDSHCLVVGANGLVLAVRTPWLEANIQLASWTASAIPFGPAPVQGAKLRCDPPPAELLGELVDYFCRAHPNEAGAYLVYSPAGRSWRMVPAETIDATPSSLSYRIPTLDPGELPLIDCHSHPEARAFFSQVDDADDSGSTKLAAVFGHVRDDEPEVALRLLVKGIPHPIGLNMFRGDTSGFRDVGASARCAARPGAMPTGPRAVSSLADLIVSAALSRAGEALIQMSGHSVDEELAEPRS